MRRSMMMAVKKAVKNLKLLWTDGAMNETAQTTYSFSSVDFGPEDADRTIVVCIGSDASGSTALTINSCSAGGVALIKGGSKTAGSTNKTDFTLFYGKVPNGVSGTVTAVASRACRDCAISVYAVTGKSTMVQTMAVSYEAGTALDFTLANVLKDDVIISGIYSQGSTTTYTYNQLTEDYNVSGVTNNRKLFSASDDKADANAQPILATASAAMTRTAGGSIAFRKENTTPPVISGSKLVAGYKAQTANNGATWGFDDGVGGLFGSYSKCGTLEPVNIPYPGGSVPCNAFAYYGPNTNRIQFHVPSGQERNGTIEIVNSVGVVIESMVITTWYTQGSYKWTAGQVISMNPFVEGETYYLRYVS